MSDSKDSTGCSWILPAVGLLFLGLKLMGHIDWHWAFVTMPFWIAPAVAVAGALAMMSLAAVVIAIGAALILVEKVAESFHR